jgi:hypothetical protein
MTVGVLGAGETARVLGLGRLGDLPYVWRHSGVQAASQVGRQNSSVCRVPAVQTVEVAFPDNHHRS